MWLLDSMDMRKSKYILPSLFTSASLLFAFLAIISAFQNDFVLSAVYILLAGFSDAFDGRVARYTDTQTDFGAALDSLADVVSFGATPALVMYFWSLHNLGAIGAGICFLYLLSVTFRLAKFDVESNKELSEKELFERRLYFHGLPCPASAVAISGLIWLGEKTFIKEYTFILVFLTVITSLYLSLMMISYIKFRGFKDSDGHGNISRIYVICFILIILVLFTMPEKFLYLIMMGYALSGLISHYCSKK